MNKISFLSGNCNMDNANLEMVIKNNISDGIVIRSTEGFSDKGEEIRTTEYFLDVQDQSVNEENADAQFLSVSEDNGNNQFIAVEVEDSGEIILHNKNVIIWSDICRICANGSDQFIPIFNGEGLENDLSNKINNYLPLKVSEDDNFPHQVCYSCAATLIAWHDMLTGCLEAQQQLEELQTKINLKDQLYNDTATEEDNIQSVTEIDTVTIEDKKINLKEDSSMETIQSIDTIESDRFIKKKFMKPVKTSNIVSANGKLHNIVGAHWASLKQINKSSLEQNSSTSDTLDSPKLIVANVDNSINILLKSNTKEKNTGPPKAFFTCNECGKFFKVKDSLMRHLRIHNDERPFTCHVCGKQFRDSGGLSRHVKDVHARVKNFSCDICEKRFASKATRDDHLRVHTGERPYVCDTCGKSFKSKASLYTHTKTHTDNFPYSCLYCNKKFRRRQELMSHTSIHTGEKNFECDKCFRSFRLKTELKRHTLIHSEERPFSCNLCYFRCRQRRYLNNHLKHKHNVTEI